MNIINTHASCGCLYDGHVGDESSSLRLRARVMSVAHRLGFSEVVCQNIGLVATEMASNLVKFAGGHGSVQLWQQPGGVLDLFALDFGPGIADVDAALVDDHSSVGTLGKGLGSIQRLSDEMMIYSRCPDHSPSRKWTGVALLARFHSRTAVDDWTAPAQVGLYSRALTDDRYNGDIVYLQRTDHALRWLHLDALGHGRIAQETIEHLGSHLHADAAPEQMLRDADRQLTGSRGAVAIAGELRFDESHFALVGIGDMHAHAVRAPRHEADTLFFAPGVLGREHKQPTTYQEAFEHRGLVITASDGIRRNWHEESFPGLLEQHPQLIAYVLGSIMGRMSDDQSLCAIALPEGTASTPSRPS